MPKPIGYDIAMMQAIAIPEDKTFSCPNFPQSEPSRLSTGAWVTIGAIAIVVVGCCVYYFNKKKKDEEAVPRSN